ncbi:hypothetical protein GQ44DRAFT_506065 [Phaeosphaeriaceae sp. PMI808]|nr:hypothetical protein GQ44DRAFT_506065 [Phaeosphaeriaceae sp. PMI808]
MHPECPCQRRVNCGIAKQKRAIPHIGLVLGHVMYCHLSMRGGKPPVPENIRGYFDLTPLTICAHLDMCYNFVLIVCCRYFYTCEHLRIQKLPSRRRRRTTQK